MEENGLKDLGSLIADVKQTKKDKPKRQVSRNYGSISEDMVVSFEINESDSALLKQFKTIINNEKVTYKLFLGYENIHYTTFYSIQKAKDITMFMFIKFMNAMNYDVNIEVKKRELFQSKDLKKC